MFTLYAITYVAANLCPTPIIENRTDLPFNNRDGIALQTAIIRCGELYKNSPCVKRFIKRTAQDYSVICGGNK